MHLCLWTDALVITLSSRLRACVNLHVSACMLWRTDLVSRSDNVRSRGPSLSWLTASLRALQRRTWESPTVINRYFQYGSTHEVSTGHLWLQLRNCIYHLAIYGCQKLIYNQCLLIRTFLSRLSICHLIRQLIKTDQWIRGSNLTATKQMHIKDGLN